MLRRVGHRSITIWVVFEKSPDLSQDDAAVALSVGHDALLDVEAGGGRSGALSLQVEVFVADGCLGGDGADACRLAQAAEGGASQHEVGPRGVGGVEGDDVPARLVHVECHGVRGNACEVVGGVAADVHCGGEGFGIDGLPVDGLQRDGDGREGRSVPVGHS